MIDVMLPLAHEAGALALAHFGRLSQGSVAAKGPLDLVTIADREVEALVIDRLRAAFPDDGILGEEGGDIAGTTGRIWVIDPIDGTFNFVRGGLQWTVSIGLWQAGRPAFGIVHAPAAGMVLSGGIDCAPQLNGSALRPLAAYDPARSSVGFSLGGRNFPLDERIVTLRALMDQVGAMPRICNSATWSMIEVATGEADAYVCHGESAWDVMGMYPILTALGASSSLDWAETPLDRKLRFAIGKPEAVALCAAAQQAVIGTD